MESIPRKPLRTASHCSLALLGLTCLLGTADARPVLPSERFPGPWLEVTQEIRDILTLNKVSACSQAAGRESSRISSQKNPSGPSRMTVAMIRSCGMWSFFAVASMIRMFA